MFAEMDKIIKCLALELPKAIWDDIDIKYRSLKTKVGKFTSTDTTRATICPWCGNATIVNDDLSGHCINIQHCGFEWTAKQ